jgi:transketolase
MPPKSSDPDPLVINTIRALAMDAVQAANSGHPGTPMALARWSIACGRISFASRYVGPTGARIGMETFGASAPLKDLQKKFGFTVEHVVEGARDQLAGRPAVSAR